MVSHWEKAAEEDSGVSIPGSAQGTTGRGTQCCGVIDRVVFGHRLHSMILEVFSNLIGSVILSAGCSHGARRAAGRAPGSGASGWEAALQVGSHLSGAEGQNRPLLCCSCWGISPGLVAVGWSGLQMHVSVERLIRQHHQVLLRAALCPFCVYPLLWLSGFWHKKHG